jgi:hypothetical protein
MAEQPQAIRSKGLLITALVVGVIAVVLYNVQLYQVRKSYETPQVKLLKLTRDISKVGEIPTAEDLEPVAIDKSLQQALGNVVPAKELEYATTQPLVRPVSKGAWLTWDHLQGSTETSPSANLTGTNFTTFALQVDPDLTPGDTLRYGDLVDVWADVYMPNRQGKLELQTRRVLEAARVMQVGLHGPQAATEGVGENREAKRGVKRYRSIGVEIRRDEVPIMRAIETHIPDGTWRLTLLRPDTPVPEKRGYVDDKDLRKLEVKPAVRRGPGGGR